MFQVNSPSTSSTVARFSVIQPTVTLTSSVRPSTVQPKCSDNCNTTLICTAKCSGNSNTVLICTAPCLSAKFSTSFNTIHNCAASRSAMFNQQEHHPSSLPHPAILHVQPAVTPPSSVPLHAVQPNVQAIATPPSSVPHPTVKQNFQPVITLSELCPGVQSNAQSALTSITAATSGSPFELLVAQPTMHHATSLSDTAQTFCSALDNTTDQIHTRLNQVSQVKVIQIL